jgi:hypothetical protein
MLRWLLKKKMKSVLENELTDAMSVLSSMRKLLHKEGSELTMIYGQGIGETAGLLAQRFHISVPNAIEGKGLDWRQLDDAYRDLIKGIETMRPPLQSKSNTTRTEAQKTTAGGVIFSYLYRLRFLKTQAPEKQTAELILAAETYAQFARLMAEIGAGLRDPVEVP